MFRVVFGDSRVNVKQLELPWFILAQTCTDRLVLICLLLLKIVTKEMGNLPFLMDVDDFKDLHISQEPICVKVKVINTH